MKNVLLSGLRISAGFLLGTLFTWGLGQFLQDFLAPEISRPEVNDAAQVAEFLGALPPLAHAGRLLAMGLGMMLGTMTVRRCPGGRPLEGWVLTMLFAAGVVMDLCRVDHGPALSIATVAMVFPCAWMGMNLASRGRS